MSKLEPLKIIELLRPGPNDRDALTSIVSSLGIKDMILVILSKFLLIFECLGLNRFFDIYGV